MDYLRHYGLFLKVTQKSTILSVSPNSLSQGQNLSYFPVTRTRKLPGQDVSISADADTTARSFVVSITLTGKYLLFSYCPTFQKI